MIIQMKYRRLVISPQRSHAYGHPTCAVPLVHLLDIALPGASRRSYPNDIVRLVYRHIISSEFDRRCRP